MLAFPANNVVDGFPLARVYLSTSSRAPVNVTISTPRMRDVNVWWSDVSFSDVRASIVRGQGYMHDLSHDVYLFGSSIEDKGSFRCHACTYMYTMQLTCGCARAVFIHKTLYICTCIFC